MSRFHAGSPQWQALRLAAKRRDGWRCVKCGSRHRLEVDHVEPVERRPDLAMTLTNLQTLCRKCHMVKTAIERGREITPERQAWREAVLALSVKQK